MQRNDWNFFLFHFFQHQYHHQVRITFPPEETRQRMMIPCFSPTHTHRFINNKKMWIHFFALDSFQFFFFFFDFFSLWSLAIIYMYFSCLFYGRRNQKQNEKKIVVSDKLSIFFSFFLSFVPKHSISLLSVHFVLGEWILYVCFWAKMEKNTNKWSITVYDGSCFCFSFISAF